MPIRRRFGVVKQHSVRKKWAPREQETIEEICAACNGRGEIIRAFFGFRNPFKNKKTRAHLRSPIRFKDICPKCGGKGKVLPQRVVLGQTP
jgi:DnaJ-class molecular chaperone